MNCLLWEFEAAFGNAVEVKLAHQANVRLLDRYNFDRFKRGLAHRFSGGGATISPVRIQVPQAGHWFLVVDLGGRAGQVEASVRVV